MIQVYNYYIMNDFNYKRFNLIPSFGILIMLILITSQGIKAQCVSQSAPTPQVGAHVNNFMLTNMWYSINVRDYAPSRGGGVVISRTDGWPVAGRVHDFNPYPTYNNLGINLKKDEIFKCLYKGTPDQLEDPGIWHGRIQNKRVYEALPGYTYFEIRVTRDNPEQFFFKINGRVTDIQFMLPGYELFDQRLLRDEMVSHLKHWKAFRFMNSVYLNTAQTWAKRVSGNAPAFVNGNPNPYRTDFQYSEDNDDNARGCSYELLIDIANYLNKDMWLTVPVMVDDNYFFELCKLIKERLKPSLNVHIELGNEIWNVGAPFNSFNMVKQKMWEEWNSGNAEYKRIYGGDFCPGCGIEAENTAGYTGPNNVPLGAFRRWQARRLKEFGDQAIRVFGDREAGGLGNRIRLILAGQLGYGGNGDGFNIASGLSFLEKGYNDPLTPYKYLYGVAIAPYYKPEGTNVNSSLAEIVAGVDKTIDKIFGEYDGETVQIVNQGTVRLGNKVEALLAKAKTYGLRLVAYEGGNELSTGGEGGSWQNFTNTYEYFRDPRSGTQAKRYIDSWFSWAGYDAIFFKNGDFLDGGYGIATQLNEQNPLRMAWVNTANEPAVPLAANRGGVIGNQAIVTLDARKRAAYWSNWAHSSYIELESSVDNGKEVGNSGDSYPWLIRCQKTGVYKILVEGQNFKNNVTVADIYLNEKLIVKNFNFVPKTPSTGGGAWSDTITMEIPYGVHALRIRPRAPIPPFEATNLWNTGRWLRIQVKQFRFILSTELPPAQPKPILGDQVVCKNNSKASYEVSELDATVCDYEWTGLPAGARILEKVQVPNTNPTKYFSGQGTYKIFIDWTGAAPGPYTMSVIAKNQTNAGVWQSSPPRTFNVKVENCGFTYTPNPVCTNADITFTPEPMSDIAKWEWNFGLGASPSRFSTLQTPPVVKYTTADTREVSLKVTDNTGKVKTYYGTVNVTSCNSPIVVTPVVYCKNATAIPLSATAAPGGTNLKWYDVPTGGSPLEGPPIPVTSVASTTPKSYYVSQMNGTIESQRTKIDVLVTEAPAAPQVSTPNPLLYCKGAPSSVNDLTNKVTVASGATLKWYTSETSTEVVTNLTAPNTTNPGNTTWYVSQSIGNCESARTLLTVQISEGPQPTVEAQNPAQCGDKGKLLLKGLTANTSYQLSYNTVAPVTYTADATGQIAVEVTQGSYTNIRMSLGSCSTSVSGTYSIADPASPNFSVITRQPVECGALGFVVLKGLTPGTGYKVSYNNVLNQAMRSTGDSIRITLPKGEYSNFVVDLNNCKSTQAGPYKLSDPVVIPPVVFLNSFSYCQNQVINVTDITSRVQGEAGYELRWYKEEGGTPTNNPQVPATTTPGNYKIWVSQANVNSCESDKKEINIQINPSTALTVVKEDPTGCGTSNGKLTISGLSNLKEYIIEYKKDLQSQPESKIFSNENGSITIGNLGAGTYTSITATPVLGNSCATNSNQKLELSEPGAPVAPQITGADEYCLGTPISPLSAQASNGGTIEWYSDANLTQRIPGDNNITPTQTEGSKIYYAVEKVGQCTGKVAQATVTILSVPKQQTMKGQGGPATCNGTGYQIELAGSEIGVTYTIYKGENSTGTVENGTGSAIIFPAQTEPGSYSIKASKGTKNCVATIEGQFRITPSISPQAFFVSGENIGCEGVLDKVKIDLSGSEAGVIYKLTNGNANELQGTGAPITFEMDATVANNGIYTLKGQNIQTGCEAVMTGSAEVRIQGVIVQPKIAGQSSYCNKYTDQITLATNSIGTNAWSLTPETAGSIDNTGLVTWNNSYNGPVKIMVSVTSNACGEITKTDTYEATVGGIPTVSPIVGDAITCPGNIVQYKVQPQTGINYIWEISNNGRLQGQNDREGTITVAYNQEFATNVTLLTVRPQSPLCGVGESQILQIAKKEGCDLFVPNVLTPNSSDGQSVWSIEGLENYPDLSIDVFNRWGTKVYSVKGNTHSPWDGTLNGSPLPTATYYYVIDKSNGSAKITGSITVMRD